MFYLAILYVHVIATCFAISTVLALDWFLLHALRRPLGTIGLAKLDRGKALVFWALIALWISGAGLVALGYMNKPNTYLLNEKLWAKVAVVCALTLNGVVLHRFVMPLVNPYAPIMAAPTRHLLLFGLCGALSSIGWLASTFLGIARPLNGTTPFVSIMGVLLLILMLAFATVAILVAARNRLHDGSAHVVAATIKMEM